ncbi:MAG: tRNA glutamyl-Q(34) synthetase GluQRS [Cellvibrionaceae bacterium]
MRLTASSPTSSRSSGYIGRFAPSPSGKLHFGSLVSAVSSYLDAKTQHGKWLVRMEDLDPPREEAGAADSIIRSLEAHHLLWDGEVLYQSSRLDAYEAALEHLQDRIYPCSCIRQRIISLEGQYDGHCRSRQPNDDAPTAIRLKTDQLSSKQTQIAETFEDLILGPQSIPLSLTGDYILRRKDGLFAYQLAVAVDDHFQGITHVVRGYDLLDSTSRQRYLFLLLGMNVPQYGHTPLALGQDGHKLSKQTKAAPIIDQDAVNNLTTALGFLGHPPPNELIEENNCSTLLAWATENWQRERIPQHSSVAPPLRSA